MRTECKARSLGQDPPCGNGNEQNGLPHLTRWWLGFRNRPLQGCGGGNLPQVAVPLVPVEYTPSHTPTAAGQAGLLHVILDDGPMEQQKNEK